MSVAICTDSSSLLSTDDAGRLGVTVVPVQLALDGRAVVVRDAEVDEFYAQLAAGRTATTSQPSPGQLLEAYTTAAERGVTEVVSIHLDARVSGTVASADLASRNAPVPVTVVDTRTASFGVGVCVRAAATVVAAGGSAEDAAARGRELGPRLRNVFVAERADGRVSSRGLALLELRDGQTRPLVACGGLDEAAQLMAELIRDASTPVRVAVGHAGSEVEPSADVLALLLARSDCVVALERYRVGPAVGAHTGPVSFGAFWWPAPG